MTVVGIDTDAHVVETINAGCPHFGEPVISTRWSGGSSRRAGCATRTMEAAEAFIIAVPTPIREDHKPGHLMRQSAARSDRAGSDPGNLVILESTSPVGTTERISALMAELRPDLTFPISRATWRWCRSRTVRASAAGKNSRRSGEQRAVIGGMTRRCAACS